MQHNHSVYDTDTHFVIDPVTRAITNVNAKKNTLIQFDHNSEVFDFEIPRFVDGHDMLQCNEVKVHYINIDAKSSDKKNKGTYEVKDYGVLESNPNTAVFSWLISDNATQLVGVLNFLITFCCTENGVVVYRWSTGICQTVSVSSGMDNGEAVIMEYPDILAQWKAELFEAGGNAVVNVTTAEANALAAIEAAGEAKKTDVLASIPDEYEALSILADQNHKNKAGAIVVEANGELIAVNDASEYPLQNLKVFGKSTQDGSPTPDAPVDIVSVGASGKIRASVHGKNILPYPFIDTTKTVNGITFTDNGDGTITVNGTATGYADFTLYKNTDKPLCTEGFLHGCPVGGSNESFSLRVSDLATKSGTDIGNGCGIYCEAKYIFIRVLTGTTVNNLTFAPMVNNGLLALPFEKGAEKQEIEITRTLPGIPVTSGGNYTDANGQQWVCDEADFARGVYVQRIYSEIRAFKYDDINKRYTTTLTYDANAKYAEEQGIPVLSDILTFNKLAGSGSPVINGMRGAASSPKFVIAYYNGEPITNATVMYPLATPIETVLSDAEIVAFKALHTNKPNTTIMNDAGAHMAVSYVADTKTYIDNKIKELMEGVTE